jgi:shikimate dehydrogenase
VSRRFALIGHPVAHSLSPAIHGAAYRELGLPYRYELIDAASELELSAAVAEVRAGRIAGANVTVPWKTNALVLADRADASAASVGAANTLVRAEDGAVVAHNTDVPGLAGELETLVAAPGRVLVLGAGGAALGAVAAARRLGASRIGVTARRFTIDVAARAWPGADALLRLGAELLPWPLSSAHEVAEFASQTALVLQATSAGMHGAAPGREVAAAVPWKFLPREAAAYDLVYNPPDTEFLRAAREAGLKASGGLGMLVGQAAYAFELFCGMKAPRAAMEEAARAALAARVA